MSTLALYRTYRPGQFTDVVGQEHVTEPLTRALEHNRVHHAYLFSGPRGCGKTSSARILARSLNCEKGPTPQPCGECDSCVALAPNGSGSVDVIELDAATHGLIDDARDLREKAHFAPVSSRFKIYIVDEAHQLGPGAANALLKLIEEPPPHLKFIFATTAPDKILQTIRSRTHHYPFRLVPAKTLQRNLQWICEQENVEIQASAVALVARAGAGSVRDSQSILGQLIAGAGPEGVTYELAIDLLGFTDLALLDRVVDAIAVRDGQTVFSTVDHVLESGHDPRRFLTDLMERFRDLIVLKAAPNALAEGLLEAPEDAAERLALQASNYGPADLVRLASVVDEGITAMKGATPTRLQLELVCARLLLPGADTSFTAVQSRLDRVERRIAGSDIEAAHQAPQGNSISVEQDSPSVGEVSVPHTDRKAHAEHPEPVKENPQTAESAARARVENLSELKDSGETVKKSSSHKPEDAVVSTTPQPPQNSSEPGSTMNAAKVRQLWPEVLTRLKEIKRTPWSLISQECAVADVTDGVVTLAFRKPNLRDTFIRRDDFQNCLKEAMRDVLLLDFDVAAIVDPSADPSSTVAVAKTAVDHQDVSREPAAAAVRGGDEETADSGIDPSDANIDESGLTEQELLEKTLGATVIQEIKHN